MALIPLRGALVEYSGQFLGPIPNIVIFQFNPESITRTLRIPETASTDNSVANRPRRETHAAEAPPTEEFSITAQFSAHDDLGAGGAVSVVPHLFGVGPQLAALMVGSHNFSMAAWGVMASDKSSLFIRNYELSMLCLPSLEEACECWKGEGCCSGNLHGCTGQAT